MAEIAPYINFNGDTKQAMEFYKDTFGGELSIQTVGESYMAGQQPPDTHDKIFHASLEGNEFVILASDLGGERDFKKGNDITLSLLCKSKEEIQSLFGKLSSGGKVLIPLTDSEWDSLFGAIEDKFKIRWFMNFDKKLGR